MTEPNEAKGPEAGASRPSPMGSVDKALLALDALAASGATGVALAELAVAVGVNKTTLHRTLSALRHRGYVDQTPGGHYRLGAAAIALGTTFLREENLPELLHPALTAICAEVDELVHLGVLTGREIVYLDKVEPERPIRVWSAVGRHRPAATTAMGRAWLTAIEAVSQPFDDKSLDFYAAGVTTRDRLRAALAAAHELGYAEEDEETERGIACIAVAILRSGQPVAAVSITAPVERLQGMTVTEQATVLRRTLSGLLPDGLNVAGL
jgi:DNA-binding IclR family transcriptional regulator